VHVADAMDEGALVLTPVCRDITLNTMGLHGNALRPGVVAAQLAGVGAKIDMALAECSESVDSRMRENIAIASERAQALRSMASAFSSLRSLPLTDLAERSPSLGKLIPGLAFAAERVLRKFDYFDAEHGALLDDGIRCQVREFIPWIKAQAEAASAIWDAYVKELQAGIAASSEEYAQEYNEVFSGADADGLD